jgi:hypothetical protein
MFSHWWWTLSDLQLRHLPGARRRHFHVGGGGSQTFSSGTCHRRFHVGGGRSQTFSFGTSWGPVVDVFTLMVGALEPSAPAPPRGPPSMFSRWWWALPDHQLRHLPGVRRRCFHVDGGRSWTFSSGTSRGPAVEVFTLMVGTSSTTE